MDGGEPVHLPTSAVHFTAAQASLAVTISQHQSNNHANRLAGPADAGSAAGDMRGRRGGEGVGGILRTGKVTHTVGGRTLHRGVTTYHELLLLVRWKDLL